jgi:hypothetical protein
MFLRLRLSRRPFPKNSTPRKTVSRNRETERLLSAYVEIYACDGRKRMKRESAATTIRRRGEMGKKKVWAKFKLKDILSNPAFLGRTVRLGDSIFEVKGIDKWLRIREEKKKRMPFTADFSFYEHVKRRTPPELRTTD